MNRSFSSWRFRADVTTGQIEARDDEARQLDLRVPAAVVELLGAETDARRRRFGATEHGHSAAALCRTRREQQVPTLRFPHGWRELVGLGAGLLQADDVGGGGAEPLEVTLLRRRTKAVDVHGGHGEHEPRLAIDTDSGCTREGFDAQGSGATGTPRRPRPRCHDSSVSAGHEVRVTPGTSTRDYRARPRACPYILNGKGARASKYVATNTALTPEQSNPFPLFFS